MVFELEQQVSMTSASAFKGQFLNFIYIECVADKNSPTSMPHFVWS